MTEGTVVDMATEKVVLTSARPSSLAAEGPSRA